MVCRGRDYESGGGGRVRRCDSIVKGSYVSLISLSSVLEDALVMAVSVAYGGLFVSGVLT